MMTGLVLQNKNFFNKAFAHLKCLQSRGGQKAVKESFRDNKC